MSAYLKGYRDYVGAIQGGKITKPEDLAILSKWTKIAPETISVVAIPPPPADSRVDMEDLNRQQDFWKAQGIVTSAVDLSKVVNYKYLDAVSSGK